jgi:hypothetical protein
VGLRVLVQSVHTLDRMPQDKLISGHDREAMRRNGPSALSIPFQLTAGMKLKEVSLNCLPRDFCRNRDARDSHNCPEALVKRALMLAKVVLKLAPCVQELEVR